MGNTDRCDPIFLRYWFSRRRRSAIVQQPNGRTDYSSKTP